MSVSEDEIIRLFGPLTKEAAEEHRIAGAIEKKESGPEGRAALPARPAAQSQPPAGTVYSHAGLDFDREDLWRGIVYATILGKPRCKSGRRW
jgi:hypothetical protein